MKWPDLPKKWSSFAGGDCRFGIVRDDGKGYYWVAEVRGRREISFPVYRTSREAHEYAAKYLRRACRTMAKNNPANLLDHANNFVGDFVNDHPWISALIGGTALGAAGYIGVLITQAVIRQTPASSTITTSDTSTGPTSTSTSPTSTSTSGSTSTSSTSSSTSSAPTFVAATAIPVYVGSAGKYVPVGSSIQFMDASTGQPAEAGFDVEGILAYGPSLGQFVAIAPGTVKVTTTLGTTTIVVQPKTGTAGIAISPKKRPMPKLRGLTSLLVGPALASGG